MDIFNLLLLIQCVLTAVQAFTELPKFSQLRLLYPGYKHHHGDTTDSDIIKHVLGASQSDNFTAHPHNTAALRMSWTLNRYNGRHAIGKQPISLSGQGRDSITGSDGLEYIHSNTAFGPFLAAKYGNPKVVNRIGNINAPLLLDSFIGKQGIIRFLSYHKDHAGGHIALWDCNHLYKTPDWTKEHHVIAVEFWESPDSYCNIDAEPITDPPHYVNLDPSSKVIARHNYNNDRNPRIDVSHGNRHRHGRLPRIKVKEMLWIQNE